MNAGELFTRCPTCKTVFRTHDEQLAVQAGMVRCGQCRMVFNGRAQLVDLDPAHDSPLDEREMGPPTVTLRTSVDLSPADDETPPAAVAAVATPVPIADEAVSTPVPIADAAVSTPAPIAEDPEVREPPASPAEELVMPQWEETPTPPRRGVRWAYGLLSLVLVLLVTAQALFHFRHRLAADYPQFRPLFLTACATLGCSVDPLRNKDEISIESHDLQADPAHQGLLILQTTLRNQAKHPIAFPHLELELNDLGGQPIVRRVFPPVEYAGGAADFINGMPAAAEWNVKLFLDASTVNAGGYNLYLFYP